MKRIIAISTTLFLAIFSFAANNYAQPSAFIDLAQFERKAMLSKELGATHVVITEGLPLATWEADPDDPYPAWFMHHISMLKVFPPKDVQPYVNAAYAANVSSILEKRCEILRKIGLKAIWNANEPAVMPEAFFTAFPELRGPRIDQPNRSTKAHFAPSSDDPEMLKMYRESIQLLLKRCPDVELFNWVTTDAGSGFDYAPGLYPGPNGNTKYKNRPMEDRVSGFMINIQKAAKDAGRDIAIHLRPIEPRQWMVPTFSPEVLRAIVRLLPRGLAVQGLEGPDGRPFAGAGTGGGGGTFSPVIGIVVPSFNQRSGDVQPRIVVNLGDPASTDFNYRLLKATRNLPQRSLSERIAALRAFAVAEVGEEQADNLIEAWSSLNAVEQNLNALNFGQMLRFGHILNRWITRPMVPFPDKLTADEKKDYRKFLFQAKGEEQAENLADIQGMRMYEGWGARLLFQRNLELTMPQMRTAQARVEKIRDAAKSDEARKYWDITAKRLQAATLLLQSADNMVAYQAQLDRVKGLDITPEENPVLGVQSGWDRSDLMELARREIDTMIALKRLIDGTKEPILDLAPTADEESIMRLGPNVSAQIKHKIDTMNAHWLDYDKLFTKPNP
ncbi:MAG: hypothetical protein QM785_09505 [Pyrinomonadaceae bacterium]